MCQNCNGQKAKYQHLGKKLCHVCYPKSVINEAIRKAKDCTN